MKKIICVLITVALVISFPGAQLVLAWPVDDSPFDSSAPKPALARPDQAERVPLDALFSSDHSPEVTLPVLASETPTAPPERTAAFAPPSAPFGDLAAAPLSQSSEGDWYTECVDCPHMVSDMTDRSLVLDIDGHPHVAYGRDYLSYAMHDGTAWRIEIVDSARGVGMYTSLALDGSGYPHISYHDDSNGDLKYAYRDAAGWHLQTVDNTGNVGDDTSLALDASGYPHISYYDVTNGDLKYAYRDGTGWHLQTVDNTGNVGASTSLALDSNGFPHISYRDVTNSDLKYTYRDAAGWHTQTVDSAGNVGYDTSLALDGSGYPHISYPGNGGLKYAYRDGSAWYTQTVDSAGNVGYYTSLAVDASGYPHISYQDVTNYDLKYTYRDSVGCHIQAVDSTGYVGYYTSVSLDANTYPHITYYDDTNDEVKYAYWDGGDWHLQTVASTGYAGTDTSLALDGNTYPHISYLGSAGLKYAYRDVTGWHLQTVDNTGGGGMYTSLAVDAKNYPHITYYDYTNGDLKYAYLDETGWHLQTVDNTGNVGSYTSMGLDGRGYPHISYFDGTNYDLKYAYQDEGGWHLQTVDSTGTVGMYTSLALDGTGYPHIAYYDATNTDLKYGYQDAAGWHLQTVDSTGYAGYYTSLALDANGYPHISYQEGTFSDLKYAYRDADAWHLQTVDSTGEVGADTSLALDGSGYPHISYYDRTNGDLKYAYRNATGWHLQTVYSTGDVGRYTSLELDRNGYPHISYFDYTNFDLGFASNLPRLDLTLVADPELVRVGSSLTYTLIYTNVSDTDAADVMVRIVLDPELVFVGTEPSPSAVPYTWNIGTLNAGQSGTIMISSTLPGYLPNDWLLTTAVKLTQEGIATIQRTVTTTVSAPLPVLTASNLTSPLGPIPGGGVLHYTLAYTNVGSGGAGNVVITDAIPAHTTLLSGSADQGGILVNGQVIWHLPLVKPGESGTVNFAARVDKPLALGTAITNSAIVASDQSTPIQTNIVTNTVALLPDLGLSTKTVEPTAPPLGLGPDNWLTYTLAYINGGSMAASGVTLTDTVPVSASFVAACCGGAYDPDSRTTTWTKGVLDVEASGVISFTVRIDEGTTIGQVIRNRAWVDSNQTPPVGTNQVESILSAAVLSADKTVTPTGFILPGTILKYTLPYTNSGNLTATSVLLTDPLPASVTYVSGGSYDTGRHTVSFNQGTVPAGASNMAVVTVRARDPLPDVTLIENTATIQSDQTGPMGTNAVANTIRLPDLALGLSVAPSSTITSGAMVTYTLNYTNAAPVPSPETVITFALPIHLVYLAGGTFNSGTRLVRFSLGTLAAGASGEVQVITRADDPVFDETAIAATATISGRYAPVRVSGPVSVIVQSSVLALHKTVNSGYAVAPGAFLTYTLAYANNGHLTATNAIITDSLPPDMEYVAGGTWLSATNVVRFQLETLGIGAAGTVSFTARAALPLNHGIQLINRAVLEAEHTFSATDSVTNMIVSAPAFATSVMQVAPEGTVPLGAVLAYTLHYTNSGNMNATGVVISDSLPGGTRYLGSSGGTLTDGTLAWNIGPVAAGAGGVVTCSVQIVERVAQVTNQALIASDQTSAVGTNAVSNSVDTPVLVVTPLVSTTGTPGTGGILTYTIPYANEGASNATGVVIVAQLPSGTTYLAGGQYLPGEQAVRFDLGTVAASTGGMVYFAVQVDGHLPDGTVLTSHATVYSDQVYPATVQSTAPLLVAGTQGFGPVGGSSGAYYLAQSFIATAPRLNRIGTRLYGQTSPYPNLRLQLWGDIGGNPDPNNVLAMGDLIPGGALTPAGAYFEIAPRWPIAVTTGQRYWLVVDGALDRGAAGSAGGRYASDNPYAEGEWKYSGDGTAWTDWDSSTDLDMSIEYGEPPHTEPAMITVRAPVVSMVKSAEYVLPFYSNNPVIFTLILTNTGVVDALDVRITDTLPARFTYQGMLAGPEPASVGGSQIVWAGQAIPAGGVLVLRFRTTAYQVVGVYVNGAQADGRNAVIADSNALVFINVTPTPTSSPTPPLTPSPTPSHTPTEPPMATATATSTPSPTPTNTPTATPTGTPTPEVSPRGYSPNGIQGTYYHGSNFDTWWKSQLDSSIDFRSSNDTTQWSARWQGTLLVPSARNWVIYADGVDDGVRVWVDSGNPIIDEWHNSAGTNYSHTLYLSAGPHTFQVDYYQRVIAGSQLHIAWSSDILAKEIIGAAGLANYGARFVSQTVPTTMFAGQSYLASVAFKNIGSQTWTRASNYQLGSQNPADNQTWGTSRVALESNESIVSGRQKTFNFTTTAPITPGLYNFQWQMLQGITWLGDKSANIVVNVIASPLQITHTHPALNQRSVSPDTWISAVFDHDLAPATVNTSTVWLTDPWGYPVAGAVEYLPGSRQVVFKPDAPLRTASGFYRVTMSTGIASTVGWHLPQNFQWIFTVSAPQHIGDKKVYYGDLHSHSGYSEPDGQGTPAQSFAAGRANGLDFQAITDHAEKLSSPEWADLLAQAQAATVADRFVGIRGFEWTNETAGHANVYGTTSFVGASDPAFNTVDKFYTWLISPTQAGAVAQFNHPNVPTGTFNNLALNYPADSVIQLIEVGNGTFDESAHYPEALAKGWHLAPTYNSDTHRPDAGLEAYRTGVLADDLTYAGVMEALRARRIFSTQDRNAILALQVNGAWMGSVIADGAATLQVDVADPDENDQVSRLELYENGVMVSSINVPSDPFTWNLSRTTTPGSSTWWYVRAVETDGDQLYSAPVWTYAAGPSVDSVYPAPGATNVYVDTTISFGFQPERSSVLLYMDPASINERTVLLSNGVANITGTLTFVASSRTWHFIPNRDLDPGTMYSMTLTGEIRAGQQPYVHLLPYSWSFTTAGSPRQRLVAALNRLRDAFDHEVAQNTGYAAEVVHLAWEGLPADKVDLVDQANKAMLGALLAALDGEVNPGTALQMGIGTSLATALGLQWSSDLGQTWIMNATGDAYGVLIPDLMAVGGNAQAVEDRLDIRLQVPRYSGKGVTANGVDLVQAQIVADFNTRIASLPDPLPNTYQVDNMIHEIEILTQRVYQSNTGPLLYFYWPAQSQDGKLDSKHTFTGLVFKDNQAFNELYRGHATEELEAVKVDLAVTAFEVTIGIGTMLLGSGPLLVIEPLMHIANGGVGMANLDEQMFLIGQEQVMASHMVDTIGDLQIEVANLWQAADDTLSYVDATLQDPVTAGARTNERLPMERYHLNAMPPIVEAIDVPNLALNSSVGGTGIGSLTLTNPGTSTIAVAPVVQFAHMGQEQATVVRSGVVGDDTSVDLLPGETRTITFTYTLPRSSIFGDLNGYDVMVRVAVIDRAAWDVYLLGPYVAHLYVESQARLNLLEGQTWGMLADGTLGTAETQVMTFTTQSDSQEVWIKLDQELGSNLDLHVYDQAGRHVGLNYITGLTEMQVSDSAYSGPEAPLEWVRIKPAQGRTFRVQVFARDASSSAPFVVTWFERAPLPALLDTSASHVWKITSDSTVSFTLQAREIGHTTPIGDLSVSISDLRGGDGYIIPASAVNFASLWPVLWPGSTSDILGILTIPSDAPDGIYTGTVQMSGKDAYSMTLLTTDVALTILLDTSPPTSTVSLLPTYSTSSTFAVAWQEVDATSGVASCDIQVRDGVTGNWTTWLTNTIAVSSTFTGQDGHTYAFRSRVTDYAGHVEDWPSTPDAETTVDISAPSSAVAALPTYQTTLTFTVTWSGQDATSGVARYDIQARDGTAGAWTDWLTNTVAVSSTFTGQAGHTYAFRSRATDRVGHVEAWPSSADTQTTVDTSAPSSAVGPLAAYQTMLNFTARWSGQAASGVGSYDIQVRDAITGTWTDWLTHTIAVSSIFTGQDGHTYAFRSRVTDQAGHVEDWPSTPDAETTVDVSAPSSAVAALPMYQTTLTFTVAWSGQDATSGVARYDIQARDGAAGVWTDWLANTVAVSSTFTGQAGHTYAFRSRATDRAGHVEAWPSSADTQTTVDTSAPSSAVGPLAAYQTTLNFTVRWSGQAASGVGSYDIQVRDAITGTWTDWLTNTIAVSSIFMGQDGHTYAFRSRVTDQAGHVEDWPSTPDAETTVDVSAPSSAVAALPMYQTTLTFTVTWNGQDATSGVARYDIQARDGAAGAWTNWLTNIVVVSSTFTGQAGHTYAFRSRATDRAGRVEAWPAGPDAETVVDVSAPTSAVTPLAAYQTALTFTVTWRGQDTTSGVASFDLHVSTGGAPYTPWLVRTTLTNSVYTGVNGGIYRFYSVARDKAGNVESPPSSPDAVTEISLPDTF